jgi:hypothetical protein
MKGEEDSMMGRKINGRVATDPTPRERELELAIARGFLSDG